MELESDCFDIHTENGCRLINIQFPRYPSEFSSAQFLENIAQREVLMKWKPENAARCFLRPKAFSAHVNLNVNIETHKKAARRVA